MKANILGDGAYTDKNLLSEKMKDYFIHVGKNIRDSIIKEGKNISIVKSRRRIVFFISMLISR